MSVDYLLHESSVGYAIFQVIHQPDTIGNRLKEVQDSVQVLQQSLLPCSMVHKELIDCRILQSLGKWSSL